MNSADSATWAMHHFPPRFPYISVEFTYGIPYTFLLENTGIDANPDHEYTERQSAAPRLSR